MSKRTPEYVKQNRQNLVSEVVFNETTSYRLKTVAASFRKPLSLVTAALGALRKSDPAINVTIVKSETKGRPSFTIDRDTVERLRQSLNIAKLAFSDSPEEPAAPQKEVKARKSHNVDERLTETEFSQVKYLRLKQVAATFDEAVNKVAMALTILQNQNPELDVRTVKSETRGRPPIEVGIEVVNQLGEMLNVEQFHFRDESTEPVQETQV